MTDQLALFEAPTRAGTEPVEKPVNVRLGKRSIEFPLHKWRRVAIKRLMEILEELEGKDVFIDSYDAGGRHYWLHNLKLPRLQLEWHPTKRKDDLSYLPNVIALWGSRGASVRIFTDYLVAVREQEYQGYWHYLLDFRNGFWDAPLDKYRSHYACLAITKFKD